MTFDETIKIYKDITLCIRIKYKDYWEPSYVFNTKLNQIGIWFFFPEIGHVFNNGIDTMFRIPKDSLQPYTWIHFCFNSDGEKYEVIVQGKKWYRGNHTNKKQGMVYNL